MVLNKRDLEKAFSPNKVRMFGKKGSNVGASATKPSTSGSTVESTRSEGESRTSIRVIVRVRPPNEREMQDNYRTAIKVVDDKMLIFDPKEEENPFFYRGVAQKGRDLLKRQNKELQFVFDRVFDDTCSNNDVFEGTTRDTIASLLDGYNCSVFAYGATGAGKTHTMLGRDGDPGITYRTMAELFGRIQAQSETRDFDLGVAYLEVYNENVRDLLQKTTSPLAIRDDGRHGIVVAGLKIVAIRSADELLSLLARGNKNRTQHPTDANEESSRSHAVFQVYVNITNKLDGQAKHVKLSMIDLAGSERASATGCKGARFKEGANINKSLLALGNCINNLADGIKHIPYRDSKLTRLLKDSLGGNCQTVMIANVGPSSLSFEDTYNTLRYANRAKKIKTNVKKNIVSCQMHITGYIKMVEEQKKEINMLKEKLLNLESRSMNRSDPSPADSRNTANVDDDQERYAELVQKVNNLYEKRLASNEKVLALESSDKILCRRIRFKLAADKRLCNLTANVVETTTSRDEQNASGKSRVNKSLLHFKRQRQVVRSQMEVAWQELRLVETESKALDETIRSSGFLDKLDNICTLRNYEIDKIRLQRRYEHARRVTALERCEMRSIDTILYTMSSTLQNYYNLMFGMGTMTDKMKQEFKQLVKSLEGVRNIKWADGENSESSPSSSDDFHLVTNKHLDHPLEYEMPIYAPDYPEDEQQDQTQRKINESPTATTLDATPILNSTVTLDQDPPFSLSPLTSSNSTSSEESTRRVDPIKTTELNSTFNLMEKKAKKRTLIDKNESARSNGRTPVKQPRKISPKQQQQQQQQQQRIPGNSGATGKENKMTSEKPMSVMSAKSIAILNKLKTDRLKLLPELSNASLSSGSGDGSLCNKAVRPKERRGLMGTHPYHKVNAKSKHAATVSSSRVPW